MTLTRAELIETMPECECGRGHTARVREEVVVQLVDEDYEAHHPWHYDLQSQADQHLRDEVAYPEGSSWRYDDVTSGLGDDKERWKKTRA